MAAAAAVGAEAAAGTESVEAPPGLERVEAGPSPVAPTRQYTADRGTARRGTARLRRRLAVGALIAIGVSGAWGCGSGDGGDAAASGEEPASPLASFLDQEVVAEADADADPDAATPAAGGGDDGQQDQVEIERRRQAAIVECMAALGFDYEPLDPASTSLLTPEPTPAESTEEWVATYGFGITTTWFTDEEVGPDLVGRPDPTDAGRAAPTDSAAPTDPAVPQTAAEREAYEAALFGIGGGPLGGLPGGCWGQALVGGEEVGIAFVETFADELEALFQEVEGDPRLVEARQAVTDCVAAEGHDYGGVDEVRRRFNRELAALEPAISHPADQLTDDDFAIMSDEELDAVLSQPRSLTPEGRATLARLQAEEVELAVVVHRCGGPVDHDHDVFREVLHDHELRFLADNQDRLAELGSGE